MPAVPKPSHKRSKPKRGQLTKPTQKVRDEVDRRSMEEMGTDVPVCERCGFARDLCAAHMDNASQGGTGRHPANIANLCGSHGIGGYNGRGGCHDWADNTKDGRAWKERKAAELAEYYETGEGRLHWKA